MNPFKSVLWRTYANVLPKALDGRAQATVNALHPELMHAIRAIVKASGITKPSQMPYQALDIITVLKRRRPRSIVELGSGQSTPVFAAYAARAGAAFTSFEQDERWADIANMGAEMVSGTRPVEHLGLRTTATGGRYDKDIPDDADFVYVDGPHITPERRARFGKAVYEDVPDLLIRGGAPGSIMCEGRLDTVDAICAAVADRDDYTFRPSFLYCFHLDNYTEMLAFRRHSFFFRRS